MKVKFDRKYNLAYIYLSLKKEPVHTYACDPIEVGGQINLDFNSSGHLVGIEVLDATKLLPPELLNSTDVVD
jgi:uncharacterized protein YuzE